MKNYLKLPLLAVFFVSLTITSCGDDDAPTPVNLPEVFTDVTLIFTPDTGGTTVRAKANDPDGEGPSDLIIQDDITLAANTTYTLTYNIENTLDPNADLNAEILEEDNEHQFFYAFTDNAFTNPTGDGNIGAGAAADPINYLDQDENGNDVGLRTRWTTGGALASGTFTANLQHQPGVKTATSTSQDGDTDFDLTFTLVIQ